MAHMGLVVFQLALVLSIQSVIGYDNGLGFNTDIIEEVKGRYSALITLNSDDFKKIGRDIQKAFGKSKIHNVQLSPEDEEEKSIEFSFLEAGFVKPDVVKKIASSIEIKLMLARAIQVYTSTVGGVTLNSKCIVSTLADADVDAIKKMCQHVMEAFGNGNLKAKALDVALSPEEEEEAIEFSFFLPMMSMVNVGMIKPDVVKKIASSPDIMSRLAAFVQEYKSFTRDAAISLEGAAPTSFEVDIEDMQKLREQMNEVFQSAGLDDKVSDVALSPEQDEKIIEISFLPLVAMADAELKEKKN